MVATVCPSRETLLQYSVGLLTGDDRDALDSHLDCCPDCQAAIMTLDDSDDTVVGRLRTPLSSESVLAEPQLRDALTAAMAMPARSVEAAVELPAQHAEEGSGSVGRFTSKMPETLGEYRLLEELGRGGMGRVYKALHTKLDRVVAVKVLPRGQVGDQKAISRFEREMRAVGRLDHPNIVQAYDAREVDGVPVLIMEYVDGLNLAEIVGRLGPLPIAEACELIRQTALALQCAYRHGLVHRDIKPSNIMLARSGEVKLLDLGLARLYAEGGVSVGAATQLPHQPADSSGSAVQLPPQHMASHEEMTGVG
jgi:serine/threonine protein kinase